MIVLFDGFAFGMLLFVLSVGLSVTLGLMNFVNLAHGAFGMLGGYVALVTTRELGLPFLLGLPAAFVAAAVVGIACERTFFRRLYRAGELNQVLFTIGLVFVASAVAAYVFGTGQQPIQLPDYLRGSVEVAGVRLGAYRLFLVIVALVVTALLVVGLEHTSFGARVRAAVDNQRMAQGLGIDVDTVFAITFALGCGLAGLGGALAIEIVGLDPTFGFHVLVYVLIVVAVGGLGSIGGSFAAAALLGIGDVAGKYFVPEIGSFLIYLLMIGILFFRPLGLFGRR
ncbi:branched-chain amino acid ABC transporter permease [Nitratireductor mangrovi]|uniref:Branched-chain amino acid ABC transporter permease n=1 Tax=Nitratireductor mangrovi TaxID=2599600 RepID=A0A5B8L3X7_9HYPH|nr:branched-chain amino acid ABC transporter permease [Nitratireductor mangrovi]QDZ02258.1 branched-chain amino acid ABC transporter permease [Nitratireductor mangrovi]